MRCTIFVARLAAILALVGATTFPSTAQTLRVSLDELAQEADEVVLGRTMSTESYWTPDRTAIFTRVVIRTEDPDTGAVRGERTVVVPGGRVGEYIHEVSDMPTFSPDEEVLVFIERHESGVNIVAGGVQGKMRLLRDSATGARSVEGASHLIGAIQPVEGETFLDDEVERRAMKLDDFVGRLKNLGIEP